MASLSFPFSPLTMKFWLLLLFEVLRFATQRRFTISEKKKRGAGDTWLSLVRSFAALARYLHSEKILHNFWTPLFQKCRSFNFIWSWFDGLMPPANPVVKSFSPKSWLPWKKNYVEVVKRGDTWASLAKISSAVTSFVPQAPFFLAWSFKVESTAI